MSHKQVVDAGMRDGSPGGPGGQIVGRNAIKPTLIENI